MLWRFQLQPCYNSIRHLWLPIAIRVLGANRFFVFFKKSLSCIALTTNLFPMRITTFLGLLCIGVSVHAQQNFQAEALEIGKERLDDFVAFLSLPNDGKDKAQLEQNKAWSEASLQRYGFTTTTLETSAFPLVLAHLEVSKELPTVALYLHLDGQAVDFSKWAQSSPWVPVFKQQQKGQWTPVDWKTLTDDALEEVRIFARSASDDKGPFMMLLNALEILKRQHRQPAFNIKVILDYEEEQSSPGLPEAVARYKKALAADLLLILDGPVHASGAPTLVFGNRGIATLTLTTYGPKTPQHSGHYGNYIPNPALNLSQLLASMKDAQGRVTIPGFYDGITLDAATKKILAAVPQEEAGIRQRTKITAVDAVGTTYQESLQYPSLNLRGLQSGWVGAEKRTIIPATAVAEIDIRLVLESNPERLITLIKNHIAQQGYTVFGHEPSDAERLQNDKIVRLNYGIHYPAFRTPVNSKEGQWVAAILTNYFGAAPVQIRTSGGSVPISPFVNQLGVPAVGLPTVNLDNNQHSPNENLRLGNYFRGIELFTTLLGTKF